MESNFGILLKAVLDSSGIGGADIKEVQKVVDKYKVNINTDLDKAKLIKSVKDIVPKLEADLQKATGIKIKVNDSAIKNTVNQVFKDNQRLQMELDKTAQKANKIQLSINNNSYSTQIDKLEKQFEKYGLSAEKAKLKTSELRSMLSNMDSFSGERLITEFDKWNIKLKGVKTQLEQTKLSYDKLAQPASNEQIVKTLNRVNNLLSKNTRATKDTRQEWQRYSALLQNGSSITGKQLNGINLALNTSEAKMRSLGKLGKSFGDQIKSGFSSFTQWVSISSVVMASIYKVRKAFSSLKSINTILTEISKTSDLTKSKLKELGNGAFSAASKYGKSAIDYLAGTQEMSRSGFYGEQGEAMAEQSILAQAAGDMTSELANSYILATNAAFKYKGNAEKINEVLDGQNSITNRNSVALTDMGTAMSEAGTVAASYRVSIEDLSAMIGTMESVTKSGGSEVGNSIKSILINLQNITSSKIVGTLDKANASMTEMKNGIEQLRNPIEILRDLSKTFNDLDEKDPLRAEILTSIGGKYQADCCLYV